MQRHVNRICNCYAMKSNCVEQVYRGSYFTIQTLLSLGNCWTPTFRQYRFAVLYVWLISSLTVSFVLQTTLHNLENHLVPYGFKDAMSEAQIFQLCYDHNLVSLWNLHKVWKWSTHMHPHCCLSRFRWFHCLILEKTSDISMHKPCKLSKVNMCASEWWWNVQTLEFVENEDQLNLGMPLEPMVFDVLAELRRNSLPPFLHDSRHAEHEPARMYTVLNWCPGPVILEGEMSIKVDPRHHASALCSAVF